MNQFGIFAKYWQPGTVKTRLAASIGDEPASRIYRCFLATLLGRFQGIADRCVLAYTPADRQESFAEFARTTCRSTNSKQHGLAGADWKLSLQAGGDLGERMKAYFAEAFASGAEHVILIGSDSPTLPVEYVGKAFELLDQFPVVLGPSLDGGYYLVGASGQVPPIFDEITWSSSDVWQQTLQHLDEANCAFGELPSWYDVDEVDDLVRLQEELANADTNSPHLGELLEEILRKI